jgi:hypothetical protein
MTASKLARMAALGAVLVSSSSALAADTARDKMPSSYTAMTKMKPLDVMHVMDKDKKGYVTRDDFMKFQQALFEQIDKNRDGQLSEKEFTDKG